jgi:hypothetical protein
LLEVVQAKACVRTRAALLAMLAGFGASLAHDSGDVSRVKLLRLSPFEAISDVTIKIFVVSFCYVSVS